MIWCLPATNYQFSNREESPVADFGRENRTGARRTNQDAGKTWTRAGNTRKSWSSSSRSWKATASSSCGSQRYTSKVWATPARAQRSLWWGIVPRSVLLLFETIQIIVYKSVSYETVLLLIIGSLRNRTAGRLRTAEWRKNVARDCAFPILRHIFFVTLPS